jgi:hypothetical protein
MLKAEACPVLGGIQQSSAESVFSSAFLVRGHE